jgi:hypothetical protein
MRRAFNAAVFLRRFSCSLSMIVWAQSLLASKQPFADGPLGRRPFAIFSMITILRHCQLLQTDFKVQLLLI